MANRQRRLIEAHSETGKSITRLSIALLGVAIACSLTLGIPDNYLLTPTAVVMVPFAGRLSVKTLLIVGPLLLIAIRFYLMIYEHHRRQLSRRIEISGIRLQRPALIVSPLDHSYLKYPTWLALYAIAPIALVILAYKSMVYQWWGSVFFLLSAISLLVPICCRTSWRLSSKITAPLIFLIVIATAIEFWRGHSSIRRSFNLPFANLEGSVLKGLDLRGALLRRANLKRSILSEADLTDAILDEALLEHAVLIDVQMNNASFEDASLTKANLTRSKMRRVNFSDANLRGATLKETCLKKSRFSNANLSGANLRVASLEDAVFIDAQLDEADLHASNMRGIDLTNANLLNARLINAELDNANLSGANLSGANLSGANLRLVAGLVQTQLHEACGDKETKLPANLTIPMCQSDDPELDL